MFQQSQVSVLPSLRQVRLHVVVALRSAGLLPWAAMVSFSAIAAVQEPLLLRTFGVHLVGDASWFGGASVLLLLGLQLPASRNRWTMVATAVLLTLSLATVQALIPLVVDGVRRQSWEGQEFFRSSGCFWLANAGVALSAATNNRASLSSILNVLVQVLLAAVLGARLRSDGCSWSWLTASIAATVAALVPALKTAAGGK
ncbi:MAG: hypothetical protein JNK15_03940 [Planctomycetes bacterium]|nr:hypothetical protein [Planctomycetota bacterium]